MGKIEAALRELVALKDLKTVCGKTEDYLERQPRAWQAAVDALEELESVSDEEVGELSASEALFGFMAWLTTQDYVHQIGKHHDCAWVADLVGRFCIENGLSNPREGWQNRIKHPEYP